nr:CAP, isoform W [Drosophila melanogaster]AGB93392.1 CAP, isoform W [Drosophila melanogaster]|eukprot:NP_001260859.1 CAP, isoform W [Drosophila melanogaster]
MDKVRELIEMTRREQEQGELPRSPSPPPVPPPPASVPPYSPESSSFHLASLQLKRQESNDSHCSDSTTHSQCTAINLASPPPPPTAQPPTPPLRQKPAPPPVPQPVSPPAPPTPQSEPELSVADSVANANADVDADADTDTEAIKKLRLLCTEQLASMPYGEQVLEELASVAQNISDQSQNKMPYPMPQLPHIKELQLNANESKSSSAWLGLPTQSDPKLLVCLSPGQRDLVNNQTQPDDLLDAHQKFVERRGYHELSKAQVLEQDHQQQQSEMLKTAAMMRELRKSLSPPAPPVPPPPVPVKSAETAAKATAHENAKRDDASEQKQKIAACESSSLENKPRRAADLGAQQSAEQRQSSSTTTSSHKATTETMSSDTAKFPTLDSMESELARMFPQHKGDIFEEQRKRFSNIEFPSHQPVSQTKRYSNIETSSYESKKRMENGQVVYDVSTSSHEKKEQGDPPKDQPVPPVPPPPIMSATKLNGNTFIDGDVAPKNSQPSRESGSGSGNGTYEEFRQRAKAAADAFGEQREQQNGLDQDRVFKDFDRLSQQMHAELQSTREKREKSASMYDLSGFTRPASGHPRLDELQQRRHAHMQELEREIERSAKSRQERMSSVPRQMEATPPRTHEIPIELEPRSRRAESLCNLNEPPPRPHTTVGHYNHPVVQDDWSRYANDLGYSENIARPFAREVEICYQRQNQRTPHCIRAPRLSASTNDLSSSSQYSYDTFNAYGGRRTHAPMLNQAQQQQRPHYGSCYSMIERDPNPRYISTTSRRGVSPAPPPVATPQQQQVPPPAYDRQQRRSSLPRELHEQQLKYILSKEEELKFEVERLQQERRRLMEEMQRAPVLPAPQRRESYRPAAKLPTLSEDEVFRQQMAEEWMNKVAEREERRQHKIIRISKIEDEHDHSAVDKATISDEFLDRVKERRHKLSMPADSDWESGAESQPQPAAQSQPESDVEAPPVRILEGQAEANLRQLPRHLREFAKFSTSEQLPDGAQMERHEEQERREEATDNAHSSATKKTSIVKTYKVSRLPPSVQARPSYKSNGYVSEPEPNYDSDYSTVRYRTQNPHRVQSVSSAVNVRNLNQDEKLYGTMPNPIKSAQNSYKNQPGRIENYTTGHSSVSEKEKKENLEQSKLSPLYTEGNLSRALAKESGYTSDSNLVFRKKEVPVSSPLSPVEQKQAYKSLQAGGEPPLLGFRKPAPEKPRDLDPNAPPIPPQPPVKGLSSYDFPYSTDTVDGSDVNIHFKTPIRHEQRQNLSEEELAIRQAEHMQKLYHEERRRKYLQELQDMNSRRHTDNFTPSQKSPIALNRYDDFPTDVTLKSLVGPKTVARALFNFQGQTSKELSFRKGDTIYIRRQIDANWYEGEHNAMIGLLPASYVEIVSRDGARTPSKRPSEGQARAKYNFQAQSGIELSLNKGELVTLTRRVDGNWFEGKIANRKGIFPCSYVEVLTDIGAEDIAARTTTVITSQSTTNLRPNLDVLRTNINNEFNTLTQNGAQPPNGILKETRTLHKTDALHVDTSSEPLAYRALYKYRPQNSDELELLEGDVVHVLEKCDDGWFVGTSQRTGCFGTFPGNYVERA